MHLGSFDSLPIYKSAKIKLFGQIMILYILKAWGISYQNWSNKLATQHRDNVYKNGS